MNQLPPETRPPQRKGLVVIGGVAILSVLVGLVISSRLDLPSTTLAQASSNSGQIGAYPVVTRNGEQESPFVQVVDRVQNAVVNVSARTEEREVPWWYHGGHYGATSSGSGFFFRDDGYILTNNHVVRNATQLTVRTSSGYDYDAKVVGADSLTDLAVLKVEPQEKITAIPFGDSEGLKVGDWAIAIGNPFPQQGLDRTVTVGVISAKGRNNLQFGEETPTFQNYIQTDASINPGNSGGPLLNLRGEAIGVNSAISSPSGGSVGIGFAIPINMARAVVPDLIASGKANRGWLGVWLSNLTEREAKHQGLTAVKGVIIDSVFSDSPAERAGIHRGDLVTSFNDNEVINSNQFSVLVSTVKKGERVALDVLREGEKVRLFAVVADRDASLASVRQRDADQNLDHETWMGMELVTFTPEIARDLGIRHLPGVYVARVYPSSPADRASISEGTIITQVNSQNVEALRDLMGLARRLPSGEVRIPLIVFEPDGSIARKILRP